MKCTKKVEDWEIGIHGSRKKEEEKARKSPLRSAAVSKEDVTFDTFRFLTETIFFIRYFCVRSNPQRGSVQRVGSIENVKSCCWKKAVTPCNESAPGPSGTVCWRANHRRDTMRRVLRMTGVTSSASR